LVNDQQNLAPKFPAQSSSTNGGYEASMCVCVSGRYNKYSTGFDMDTQLDIVVQYRTPS